MKKLLTPIDKAFMQGAACAVACIVKSHGANTATDEALRSIGLHTRAIAVKYGVDHYDLEILWPLRPRMPQ